MKILPSEIQRYILEFIPHDYCMFCSKKLSKINNKFCNNLCVLQYNNNFWGDLIYIRNSVMVVFIIWSPIILFPSVNDNVSILESKYAWYCGISSFIILTLYTEQYFLYKAFVNRPK
jgi:predicted nucleic acid-binding Zn ribbon protein